jgi:hypothetical protein
MKLTEEQIKDLKKIAEENIMLDHDDKPFFLEKGIKEMVRYVTSIPFASISNDDKILTYSGNQNPFTIVINPPDSK